MKSIQYVLESADQWLHDLHQASPSVLVENRLELLPNFGTGSIESIKIQPGLYGIITDLRLKEFVVLERGPKPINDGFILNIYISNTAVSTVLNGKNITIGVKNKSVVLSSATTSAELIFPKDIPIKVFHIYFTRDWLLENAIDKKSNLYDPVVNDQPIYIVEQLDYNFAKVRQLFDRKDESVSKIKMRSIIYQVMEHLVIKLEKRGRLKASNLSAQDINSLMLISKTIEESVPNVISNEQLAKMANISLAKFKRIFKQVYGTSPYQYHIAYKLNVALEMLKTREYSVSEVGYAVGYQNLGHFSKAFHKYHQVLPKDI